MQWRRLLVLTLALGLFFSAMSVVEAGTLLVSCRDTDQVLKYDVDTGTYLGVFAELDSEVTYTTSGGVTSTVLNEPTAIDIGPDGNVYIGFRDGLGDNASGGVACYSPLGDYLGVFSTVDTIMNLNFTNEGDLLVRSYEGQKFYRIDGPGSANSGTATYLGRTGIAIVDNPAADPTTPGSYYFGSSSSGRVYLTDPANTASGQHVVLYDQLGSDLQVTDLEFGPDGRLYAIAYVPGTTISNSNIYVIDPTSGSSSFTLLASYDVANPDLNLAVGMTFDGNGNVLVCNSRENTIAMFSMTDGSFQGNLVDGGELVSPYYGVCVLPDTAEVPEPSTVVLMAAGLLGLLMWRRK